MARQKDSDTPAESTGAPAAGPDSTIAAPDEQAQQQTQLQIDESKLNVYYASTVRVSGTAEEMSLDFSQGIRPSGQPNVAVMRLDARVVVSPWAAKRLALALGQAVQRYEQAYGVLEIDARKRMVNPPAGGSSSTTST